MSLASIYTQQPLKTIIVLSFQLNFPRNSYAKASSSVSMLGMKKKKTVGKASALSEKRILPVETDPVKLVNYVCGSNIYKTGEDVKLGPDSDYPDWLWSLRTEGPPPLEDLDPNSKQYWKRIRKMGIQRQNQLLKLRKF
ncbi:39S ribosomal protein L54, mitochondrial [Sitophilus oryzae]|uniref:Large ribosomal subunit protein mL54 n=1 Tax=Sitophilus oryzae TaxID=7048 RepID=A0A6J2XRH6_SITOR|nr:39S ribosomal protein L54, mitochondrial [Sitophilus oryzae]